MFNLSKTDSTRALLIALSTMSLTLLACGSDKGTATNSNATSQAVSSYELPGDHAIGNPAADVTIVEYASVTCGHCANFHDTVYPELKKKYIDTGKVRFVFREFPTGAVQLAQAGFMIANCGDEDRYFDNISLQFKRFKQIVSAAQTGGARDEYLAIAKSAGLSEDDFNTCLQDPDNLADYKRRVQVGIDAGVTGTPSFFINGEKTAKAPSGDPLFTIESWDETLASMLGLELPAKTDETTSEDASE